MIKVAFYVKYILPQFLKWKKKESRDGFQAWLDPGFFPSLRLSFPHLGFISSRLPPKWWHRWSWSVLGISPPSLATWAGGKCFFPNSSFRSDSWLALGHELAPQPVTGVKELKWSDMPTPGSGESSSTQTPWRESGEGRISKKTKELCQQPLHPS